MKKLLVFFVTIACLVVVTGCGTRLRDIAYSYTNKSTGEVTVIRLYANGKVLINRFNRWSLKNKDKIHMCKGSNIVGASYNKIDSIINITIDGNIIDKIIVQKDGGLRYKSDVYRPDERFKDIKPVGEYGGKAYETKSNGNGLYMCFIDEETVLIASLNRYSDNIDVDYYDYDVSADKIVISDKNFIFRAEGENYLVMDNGWGKIVMKYTGFVDDYKLWNYILSDE